MEQVRILAERRKLIPRKLHCISSAVQTWLDIFFDRHLDLLFNFPLQDFRGVHLSFHGVVDVLVGTNALKSNHESCLTRKIFPWWVERLQHSPIYLYIIFTLSIILFPLYKYQTSRSSGLSRREEGGLFALSLGCGVKESKGKNNKMKSEMKKTILKE